MRFEISSFFAEQRSEVVEYVLKFSKPWLLSDLNSIVDVYFDNEDVNVKNTYCLAYLIAKSGIELVSCHKAYIKCNTIITPNGEKILSDFEKAIKSYGYTKIGESASVVFYGMLDPNAIHLESSEDIDDKEDIDYEKIEKSLKLIGVDIKDSEGYFKSTAQILLEISNKWVFLTQETRDEISEVMSNGL